MYNDALSQMSITFKGVYFLCHINCIVKYWRPFTRLVFLLVCLSFFTISSYADVNDLMIGTGSNALMTMELDDSDYSVMPMSSLGTVVNTISPDAITVVITSYDTNGQAVRDTVRANKVSGRYDFNYSLRDDSVISQVEFILNYGLPSAGIYDMSFDFASDFAMTYRGPKIGLWYSQNFKNASAVDGWIYPECDTYSGDVYMPSYSLDFGNINSFSLILFPTLSDSVRDIGGSFAVRYVKSTSGNGEVVGFDNTSADYQSGVSSSLSDLSSSVDTMTDEISGVTEAIQNLQGAMEPHYSNVLTQLHHITEQLHAFYDQVYNNIHLPELSMLTQIKEAIESIDLQIEVDISEVKTAINNMSTAVQNKLQTTTDQITNGYDNSGIVQENEKLDQSINDYDEVESEIFDEAGGFVGEFEYPSVDSLSGSVIKALAFVGSFLQSIFLNMGDFSSIITFSLTMIFVMVVVGYHRIRS